MVALLPAWCSDGLSTVPEAQHSVRPGACRLLQGFDAAVYTCDTEGRITFHNAVASALWGGDPSTEPGQWCGTQRLYDVTGQPLALDAYPTRVAVVQALAGADASPARELIVRRPDGSHRHVLCNALPGYDADGKLIGVLATMLDITEPRQGGAARLQREVLLQRVFEPARSALWDLDFQSGCVQLSEGWSDIMGQPRAPTTTTFSALAALVPLPDRVLIGAALKPLINGASTHCSVEYRVRTPAGDTVWIHSEGMVIERGPQGQAVRAIGTNSDITERKRAQRTQRTQGPEQAGAEAAQHAAAVSNPLQS